MSQDSWNITFTIDQEIENWDTHLFRRPQWLFQGNFLHVYIVSSGHYVTCGAASLTGDHWSVGEWGTGCVHLESDGETGRTTHSPDTSTGSVLTLYTELWVIPQNINTTDSQKSPGHGLTTDVTRHPQCDNVDTTCHREITHRWL